MPPPLPVVQSPQGLACSKNDKGASYLRLHQNIAMRDSLQPVPPGMTTVPYDYNCPVLSKEDIKKRTCSNCADYFSTIKAKDNHRKVRAARKPSSSSPAPVPTADVPACTLLRQAAPLLRHAPLLLRASGQLALQPDDSKRSFA